MKYTPEQELKEIQQDISIMKSMHLEHMKKFKNIDAFFNDANSEIQIYFQNQDEFETLDDFIAFLRKGVQIYIDFMSYTGDREGLNKLKEKLGDFDETYDKLIYFGEFNPVEALRERLRAQDEAELHPETTGVIQWVKNSLGKIIK